MWSSQHLRCPISVFDDLDCPKPNDRPVPSAMDILSSNVQDALYAHQEMQAEHARQERAMYDGDEAYSLAMPEAETIVQPLTVEKSKTPEQQSPPSSKTEKQMSPLQLDQTQAYPEHAEESNGTVESRSLSQNSNKNNDAQPSPLLQFMRSSPQLQPKVQPQALPPSLNRFEFAKSLPGARAPMDVGMEKRFSRVMQVAKRRPQIIPAPFPPIPVLSVDNLAAAYAAKESQEKNDSDVLDDMQNLMEAGCVPDDGNSSSKKRKHPSTSAGQLHGKSAPSGKDEQRINNNNNSSRYANQSPPNSVRKEEFPPLFEIDENQILLDALAACESLNYAKELKKQAVSMPSLGPRREHATSNKRKREQGDPDVSHKVRLVTPFNFHDGDPTCTKVVPIIPAEKYAVKPSVTTAFRKTLPRWRKPETMPTSIMGRELKIWVKEITAYRGAMWLIGFTNKSDESIAVEIGFRPKFGVEWPMDKDGNQLPLTKADFQTLRNNLNAIGQSGYTKHRVSRCYSDDLFEVAGWTGEKAKPYITVEFENEGAHRFFKHRLMPYEKKRYDDSGTESKATNSKKRDLFEAFEEEKANAHECRVQVPWNGNDEPVRLKLVNEEIPVETQIMAAIDTFSETAAGGEGKEFETLTPGKWVKISGKAWKVNYADLRQRKTRHVTYEVTLPYENLPQLKVVSKDISFGEFVWGSKDIECVSARGSKYHPFALNRGDVISMITSLCYKWKDNGLAKDPFATYTFALGVTHGDEKEMLDDYLKFRIQCDGGIGYNSIAFDDPYILLRAHLLGSELANLSIFKGHTLVGDSHVDRVRKDPKAGLRSVYIPGYIHLDSFMPVKKDQKLQSKKMGDVCPIYLKPLIDLAKTEEEKKKYYKMDYAYSKLYDALVSEDPAERMESIKYNIQDCRIPAWMVSIKKFDLSLIETMRLTRINAYDYMVRGQQVKVWYMMCILLMREKWALNKADVAAISKLFKAQYVGGFVIEPLRGLQEYVQTFDFASLYPSIILAYFLCYSTIIANAKYRKVAEAMGRVVADLPVTPEVSVPVVQGVPMKRCLLPRIVFDLLGARSAAKVLMNEAEQAKLAAQARGDQDAYIKAQSDFTVFNARQLEVKINANTVYGFAGVSDVGDTSDTKKKKNQTRPYVTCKIIAKLICACGRVSLRKIAALAQSAKWKGILVYGDTDSIMVKFEALRKAEEARIRAEYASKGLELDALEVKKRVHDYLCVIGKEFAADATKLCNKPMKLEHENVSVRMLPVNKKNYVKFCFEPDEEKRGIMKFMIKGLYPTRRDWCSASRDLGEKVLKMFVKDGAPLSEIRKEIVQVAIDLRDNKIPLKKLLLNKKIADMKTYKRPEAQAHSYLAMRLQKSDPMNAPETGDNVAWLQVKRGFPEQSKNVATLDEMNKDNLQLDEDYYWDKQIAPPLAGILDVMDLDFSRTAIGQANAKRKRLHSVTEYFNAAEVEQPVVHANKKQARISARKPKTAKEKKEDAIASTKKLSAWFSKPVSVNDSEANGAAFAA